MAGLWYSANIKCAICTIVTSQLLFPFVQYRTLNWFSEHFHFGKYKISSISWSMIMLIIVLNVMLYSLWCFKSCQCPYFPLVTQAKPCFTPEWKSLRRCGCILLVVTIKRVLNFWQQSFTTCQMNARLRFSRVLASAAPDPHQIWVFNSELACTAGHNSGTWKG